MSSKRSQITHYKIAGRDEPTVQVSKYRRSSSQPLANTENRAKKRKGRTRNVTTFHIDGTLQSAVDALPDQEMSESPPSPSMPPLISLPPSPPHSPDTFETILDPAGQAYGLGDANNSPPKKVCLFCCLYAT
ncbi:hypothetical protein FRC08_014470 [Ceratobasidium sp. 394]|nr:hypothetical protein FRC08_014470 [Ceratobasidium sp. 394]